MLTTTKPRSMPQWLYTVNIIFRFTLTHKYSLLQLTVMAFTDIYYVFLPQKY